MYLYRKKIETKIVRVQHEIEIKMRATAADFKAAFANIPDDAQLIDQDLRDDNTILVFQQETPDPSNL